MRRELKLVFLVLVLIVGPSATLSFLAGRVLGHWQVVVRDRMAKEAEGVLDAVVAAWVTTLDDLREQLDDGVLSKLEPRMNFSQAVRGVSELYGRYAWIRDVSVVHGEKGVLYPVALTDPAVERPIEDSRTMASLVALRHADQQGHTSTNLGVSLAAYQRFLDAPDMDPASRALGLLRLAQGYRAEQQPERAVEALSACVELSGVSSGKRELGLAPLRDPEEGFYLDLVALEDVADLHEAAGREEEARAVRSELRRRAVERFDGMSPLQRQLLVARLSPVAVKLTNSEERISGDDFRWRECVRTLLMTSDERGRMQRDFGGVYRSMGEEGWQWVRFGDADYLVARFDAKPRGGVLAVIQFDRRLLADEVVALAGKEGRPSGVLVTCGVQESARKPQAKALILVERRLAPPLDRFVITAMPADPLAFAANATLQKRLYGLGGALLMIGVMVGGWLMWREAAWEIHRAREHSDFAAAVSHDLRTPLSSMRMLAESLYLERVQDEAKRKKFLEAILKESDRLSRLTDRALYFIRYGEGMMRYRFSEGDLGGVVRETVETFATGIGAHVVLGDRDAADGNDGWVIRLRIDSGLEPVWFDAGAMEQVVFNLLDNAIKYSGHAHVIEVEVRGDNRPRTIDSRPQTKLEDLISRKRHRASVEIAVKDHGAGMDKDEIRRIIRPYIRGRMGVKSNAHGIGLGLALCRHVIRAHKGRFEIESRVGAGSTFRVILPAGEG